jgi:hypothetical protein
MTPVAKLRTVTTRDDLRVTLRAMDEANVAQLPVMENGELIGAVGREEVLRDIARTRRGLGEVASHLGRRRLDVRSQAFEITGRALWHRPCNNPRSANPTDGGETTDDDEQRDGASPHRGIPAAAR